MEENPSQKSQLRWGSQRERFRKRFARLVKDQALQIIGKVDPVQAGYDAPAMIGVTFKPIQLESAIDKIIQFPEISTMVLVSGEFDLLIEVVCRDRYHLTHFLNQCLRKVPGVVKVQTHLILQSYKIPDDRI